MLYISCGLSYELYKLVYNVAQATGEHNCIYLVVCCVKKKLRRRLYDYVLNALDVGDLIGALIVDTCQLIIGSSHFPRNNVLTK